MPHRTPTIERIRVRYGETDQMGHAYYANYLYWLSRPEVDGAEPEGLPINNLKKEESSFR